VKKNLFPLFFVALVAGLPLVMKDNYYLHLMILFLMWVVIGSAWNLIAGYTGQVSFGDAAFFGCGAYTAGLLAHHLGDGLVFDLPQLFGPDLSLGTLRPGIHHCLGPKETAYVVCSERWPVAHVVSLVAVISERNARRPR